MDAARVVAGPRALRGVGRVVLLTLVVAFGLHLGPAPVAAAGGWQAHPDVWLPPAEDPCTGEVTATLLHEVQMLVNGREGHEGFKFRGRFTSDNGTSGTFRDLDQFNETAASRGIVFTRVASFNGTTLDGRRVLFTAVFHVVDRDGEVLAFTDRADGRCVGGPARG